ncbi:TetR/AcrR family transcriptional regulator [Echinicola marina]|uniref:TetR/AcrR family transcriptional regulator n=1 Tax=Echinicola marina TaxID=2859768 RepID=UPI001CF6F2DB|nr:TetR/AcrR family transcriptional regulator [Echinicola marina]UCS92828.1 TetR/AcrR family transcriptional regulator [Echinicola marina]
MSKKEQILAATLDLIKDHGFHGCPMSMVAKNSNVAAGTIYHHFENKDDLILELYHYVNQKLVDLAVRGDDPNKDFKSRFMDFWHNLKSFYLQEKSIHGFIEQFMNSPYNSEEVQMGKNKWHDWLHDFFSEGINTGVLRSGVKPAILAILVHGSVVSSVKVSLNQSKKVHRDQLDLGEIAEVVWDGIKFQG